MGIIRKQSLQSTFITYIGFGVGALNTLLFTKYVPAEIYGLTRLLGSVALIFFALASMGSATLLNKFYPYYRSHLAPERRDLFGIVLIISAIGYVLVVLGTFIFHDLIVRKYSANSALFVQYFYLLYPFTFFQLIFTLFEHFSNNQYRSIFPIFLKEVCFRIVTTLLIGLLLMQLLDNVQFLWSYSLIYALLAAALILYLKRENVLHFTFQISNVTRKLADKMISFNSLVFGGGLFIVISQNIDSLVVGSTMGLPSTASLEFNTFVSNVIQVPQRSMIAISIPILAQAWKEKDLNAIRRIYARSSFTLLIFSLLIFLLIWLNYESAFRILELKDIYWQGRYVVLFLGLSRVVELGTGVNQQILGTSNMWRFEFFTTIVLVTLSIPLSIWFIKMWGITGSAIAGLTSVTIYNGVRYFFLYYRFGMQPFTKYTLYVVLLAAGAWAFAEYLIRPENHFVRVALRSIFFVTAFLGPILFFNWSQDLTESWHKGTALVKKYLRK
ncbi:hypothetical protein ACWKWU_11685 [Chitinophaga lutea]